MELFIQVNVVNGFRSTNNTFSSFLIEKDGIYRVIKIHSDKAGVGLTLEDVGVVVPKVQVTIDRAKDSPI
jgi:hypothetical protein